MNRPLIAIPMGDAAGIGPEIVLKTIADAQTQETARCVVIGDKGVLELAGTYPGMPELRINVIREPAEGRYESGVLNLIDLHNIDPGRLKVGTVDGMCGKAAYEYIAESIRLANARLVDAVATTPINKESLRAGAVPYIGHTEIFGALTGTEDPLTMFEVRGMRVFFLTRHVSLRQACDLVTKDRIKDYVRRCTEALRRLGVTEGTMAIAGRTPYSGAQGLCGNEEVEKV